MQVVIVSGLSGAGKTQAVICLEDLGYYCVDNMPPALIKSFLSLARDGREQIEKAAFVVDVRGGEFFADLRECLADLQSDGTKVTLVFLEASEQVLIRRFNETRRAHPLAMGASTQEGIRKEMEALSGIRAVADFVIDTSNMKSMQLREEVKRIFTAEQAPSDFTVNLVSFGFKNGIPLDADMVFDVRFIPNPFYLNTLRKLTGNNQKVREYVMRHPESGVFIQRSVQMIGDMIPCFIREGKFHLNIAVGCTGGQHRSVAMANAFAEIFEKQGRRITLKHRDL